MARERPVTRADFEALVAAIREAVAAGIDRTTVDWMGAPLLVERGRDGGALLRAPGQPTGSRVFMPAATRPDAFPPELPFVPDAVAMISAAGPQHGSMVLWPTAPDADRLFADLAEEAESTGWTLLGVATPLDAPATERLYERDGVRRTVMLADGIVTVVQRPAVRPRS